MPLSGPCAPKHQQHADQSKAERSRFFGDSKTNVDFFFFCLVFTTPPFPSAPPLLALSVSHPCHLGLFSLQWKKKTTIVSPSNLSGAGGSSTLRRS